MKEHNIDLKDAMNHECAVAVIKETKQILDRMKVEFWLESGTLLGAVRDGGFIKWDYDIDVGTTEKYLGLMEDICNEFNLRGFSAWYSKHYNTIGLWKNGISIDFNFWRLNANHAVMPLKYAENFIGKVLLYFDWILMFNCVGKASDNRRNRVKYANIRYYLSKILNRFNPNTILTVSNVITKLAIKTKNRRGLVKIPIQYYEEIGNIIFYDKSFGCPKDLIGYLSYYFGDDWKTPKSEWNYLSSKTEVLSNTEHIGEKWHHR